MGEENTNFFQNDELMKFLSINPMFDMEQMGRYSKIKASVSTLNTITKHVESYIQNGQKILGNFHDIVDTFSSIPAININPSYKPIIDFMKSFQKILESHFSQVESQMVNPIQSFLKHDVKSISEYKRTYVAQRDKYLEEHDKFVQISKKNLEKKEAAKKSNLMELNKQTTLSLHEFVLQTNLTETRYNNLVGNILIGYVKSFVSDFQNAESIRPDIDAIAKEINDSNEEITKKIIISPDEKNQLMRYFVPYWQLRESGNATSKETTYHGYMWKRTGIFAYTWEKLFFYIINGVLYCSQSPSTMMHPLWGLQLVFTHARCDDDQDRPNCIQIASQNKTIVLQAPSNYDRSMWLSVITNNVEHALHGEQAEAGVPCADCGAPNACWLIVNRGCLVCEQCAGAHRGLSAKYSRVRSFSMDNIDKYATALLHELGGDSINLVYVKPGSPSINQDTPRDEREAFIRDKYVNAKFADIENAMPPLDAIKTSTVELLRSLVAKKTDERFEGGVSALHLAAIYGDPAQVALLAMNCPELINQADDGGWTPIMYASYFGLRYVVDALLQYDADVNAGCAHPYAIAADARNEDVLDVLAAHRPEKLEGKDFVPPTALIVPGNIDLSHYQDPKKAKGKVAESLDPRRTATGRRQTIQPKRRYLLDD